MFTGERVCAEVMEDVEVDSEEKRQLKMYCVWLRAKF